MVLLMLLRIKDHVVLAGLSVLLLVPNMLTGDKPRHSSTSLSSNLSIATQDPMDAAVASTPMHGNTSDHTHRCQLPHILTLVDRDLAEQDPVMLK